MKLIITSFLILCFTWPSKATTPTDDIDVFRKLPQFKIDENRLAIPIRRAGNLILIRAKADTLEGNFILDTGAPYLVLNETFFRNYRNNPNEFITDVNGDQQNQKIVEIDSLLIKGISFTEIIADATNLAQIENKKGIKILGLLGVNLFLGFELEIDLANNVLYLNKLNENNECLSYSALSRCKQPDMQIDVHLRRDVVSFQALLNGKKLRLGFDTGAEYNILSNDISTKALDGVRIIRKMQLYGSSGGSSEVLAGSTDILEIAGFRIANMQTIVTDFSAMRQAYGNNLDGLVGYPLLSRGIICLNFQSKQMRFYTNVKS